MLTPAGMTRAHGKLISSWRGNNKKNSKPGGAHIPTKWTVHFMIRKHFLHYGKFFPKICIGQLIVFKERQLYREKHNLSLFTLGSYFGPEKNLVDFGGRSGSGVSEQRRVQH